MILLLLITLYYITCVKYYYNNRQYPLFVITMFYLMTLSILYGGDDQLWYLNVVFSTAIPITLLYMI